MNDPLWSFLDNVNHSFTRDQLEIVIQRKKITEIHRWFYEHFINCDHRSYMSRCPIILLQGSTGCGKSSVLRFVAKDLNIPIKEYSETTDLTAINFDLAARRSANSIDDRGNTNFSIEKRKAMKFEQYIVNNIKYDSSQLFAYSSKQQIVATQNPTSQKQLFNSGNVLSPNINGNGLTGNQRNFSNNGIIIHVETPLTFARYQAILTQTLYRLLQIIKEMAKRFPRRVAIVFETLEGEHETLSLPSRLRTTLGVHIFKLNPITKANMKKLVDNLVKTYDNLVLDRSTVEQLVNDSDGDMRACIKTLQLLCNRSTTYNSSLPNGIDNFSPHLYSGYNFAASQRPVQKKQKVNHFKFNTVNLSSSLMRDTSRSLSFFHVLGKIFYQKRLYPAPGDKCKYKSLQALDRPFPTENSTDQLLNLIDVEPKNLISWLHQHYYKFCHESNVIKAALFLENLSEVDTVSLSSIQSSQFYEYHHIIDQLQVHLAIETTVFSLYENQLDTEKTSHKKIITESGCKIVKPSVENFSSSSQSEPVNDLYSFKKPIVMSLTKIVEYYQKLLNFCALNFHTIHASHTDPNKILIDYIPYMRIMSRNWLSMSPESRRNFYPSNSSHPIFDDESVVNAFTTIEGLDLAGIELENIEPKHERLREMIEGVEILQDRTFNQILVDQAL